MDNDLIRDNGEENPLQYSQAIDTQGIPTQEGNDDNNNNNNNNNDNNNNDDNDDDEYGLKDPEINKLFLDAEYALDLEEPLSSVSDRVHDTFINLLLYGGTTNLAYNDDNDDDDDDDQSSGVGAAEEAEESSDGGVVEEGEEDEESIFDFDKISENESVHDSDDVVIDTDFSEWINFGGEEPEARGVGGDRSRGDTDISRISDTIHRRRQQQTDSDVIIAEDLSRIQLSTEDEEIVNSILPERFVEIAIANNRPALGPIPFRDYPDKKYTIIDEPAYILREMCMPGGMLRSSVKAAEILQSLPPDQISSHPVVQSIDFALRMMIENFLEPAYMMKYHSEELLPLLDCFYDGHYEDVERQGVTGVFSAYSATTGRRQLPLIRHTNTNTNNNTNTVICSRSQSEQFDGYSRSACRPVAGGSHDHKWVEMEDTTHTEAHKRYRAIRKPAAIELGRMLWSILDHDVTYHQLHHGRLNIILQNESVKDPRFSDRHLELISSGFFTSPAQLTFWSHFYKYCRRVTQATTTGHVLSQEAKVKRVKATWLSRPFIAVVDLGLEDSFEELYMSPADYHVNLARFIGISVSNKSTNTMMDIIPSAAEVKAPIIANGDESKEVIKQWLKRCGTTSGFSSDPNAVLGLFANAFIDHYSQLPLVRRIIFETFISDGEVSFSPTSEGGGEKCQQRTYHVYQFMNVNPLEFLNLYHLSTGSDASFKMKFNIEIDRVMQALQVDNLFLCSQNNNYLPLNLHRRNLFRIMTKVAIKDVEPAILQCLLHQANQSYAAVGSRVLGHFCAEGPYQPTKLEITPFTPAASTWDCGWNVVEAVPDTDIYRDFEQGYSRVCGTSQSDDGVVTFAFCNSMGELVGHCTWLECTNRPDGVIRHNQQCQDLLAMIIRFSPHCIAVGMSKNKNKKITVLFQSLNKFVKEYVRPTLQIVLPVVWVRSLSAVIYRHQDSCELTDPELREAVSIARYARDPLMELCRLFDPNTKEALQLPLHLSCASGLDRDMVYKHLEREMTLWVSTVAYDLSTIANQTHAPLVLQFCAGLGIRKAKNLLGSHNLASLGSRAPLRRIFEHSPALYDNFVTSCRIQRSVLSGGEGSEDIHPLDCTILNPMYYPLIELTLADISGKHPAECWTTLMTMTEHERWSTLNNWLNPTKVQEFLNRHNFHVSRSLVELFFDEMVYMGNSYMRRPFRCISDRMLMKELTGIAYVSKDNTDQNNAVTLHNCDLTVREGDILECSIEGYRIGNNIHNPFDMIRLITTQGIDAVIFIGEEGIPNEELRLKVTQHMRIIKDERNARADNKANYNPIHPDYVIPEELRKGSPMYGKVYACNFNKCELRLRWVPFPTISHVTHKHLIGDDDMPIDINIDARSHQSGVSTIAPEDIENRVTKLRTKAAKHVYFRNVCHQTMMGMLSDSAIGEALLRPKTGRDGWINIYIKTGVRVVSIWPARERQGHNGGWYLEIPDRRLRSKSSFQTVDHCVFSFVDVIKRNILSLRSHRRFVHSKDEAKRLVMSTVQSQKDTGMNHSLCFAYAFFESESVGVPLPYECYYYIGCLHHTVIHVNHTGFHIRLYGKDTVDGKRCMVNKYFFAPNPEELSTSVKDYSKYIRHYLREEKNAKVTSRASSTTMIARDRSASRIIRPSAAGRV